MSHRPIREVIRDREVVTADSTASVADAARLMAEQKIGAMIVCEENRLVGVFTERDALYRVIASGRDPERTPLAEVMTRHPQTISPDKPLGHALHLMYEGGFRHVPVVERDRPIGMVTSRDALSPDLREFAEEMDEREHIGEILG